MSIRNLPQIVLRSSQRLWTDGIGGIVAELWPRLGSQAAVGLKKEDLLVICGLLLLPVALLFTLGFFVFALCALLLPVAFFRFSFLLLRCEGGHGHAAHDGKG